MKLNCPVGSGKYGIAKMYWHTSLFLPNVRQTRFAIGFPSLIAIFFYFYFARLHFSVRAMNFFLCGVGTFRVIY